MLDTLLFPDSRAKTACYVVAFNLLGGGQPQCVYLLVYVVAYVYVVLIVDLLTFIFSVSSSI